MPDLPRRAASAGADGVRSPSMPTLAARIVLTPDGVCSPGAVELDGPTIVSVAPAQGPVPDRVIAPGFVDLQVNGHDDVDVARATGADWDRLDELLLAQGVTTWCPTLVTAPLDSYAARLERIATAARREGARPTIAGAHLEGPFLGGLPGAHPPQLVRPIDRAWLDALPPVVRIVTLGAEIAGALAATAALAARGVTVAAGHTLATHDELRALVDAGARLVTHLFNAMTPLHHREPGVVGAALTDDRVVASVIADLVHVHPTALTLAFRAKGPAGVALVTDAVAWRAATAGPVRVQHHDGAPRLRDGTLAGSALTMDQAVRNVVAAGCTDLAGAVTAAATTPARVLGLDDRGAIAPGRRADLAVLDADLRVEQTWVAGEPAWAR